MSRSSRAKRRIAIPVETDGYHDAPTVGLIADPVEDVVITNGSPLPVRRTSLIIVVLLLSFFILGIYLRAYDSHNGWTKLDGFGAQFEKTSLPRVQRTRHFVDPHAGFDGQFYAQLAIDPSVQDPAFNQALDEPAYRARRIGLPAIAFCLGWAKPRWIIQAYALTNLLFWFVLAGALIFLFRPWTGRQQWCLSLGLLSFGSIASMQHSFVDLPATTLVFVGIALGGWGGYAALAGAALTRETSLLAAFGGLDLRRPFTITVWKRNFWRLAVAGGPIILWMLYLRHRFGSAETTAGYGNFGFPLQALGERLTTSVQTCLQTGLSESAKAGGPFGWLYLDEGMHEVLTVVGLFAQGLFLALRWKPSSTVWRTGICFAALGCILGPAVWEWTGAAARVLLPMTLCYYLLVARERDAWFWPFFVLGSLSVPRAVYDFWTFS